MCARVHVQVVRAGVSTTPVNANCWCYMNIIGQSDAKKKQASFSSRATVQSTKTYISRRDPCFRFIRGLEGCSIERRVDEPRARELYNMLVEAGNGAVLGDLGMVMIDPPIYNMLVQSCYLALTTCVTTLPRTLPTNSKHLRYLTQLLLTATLARQRIKTQHFDEEPCEHLLTTIYPILAKLKVEDLIASVDPTAARSTGPQKKLVAAIKDSPFIGALVMHYALEVLSSEPPDFPGLVRTLPMLADTIHGGWHHVPEDGSARFQEDFAATIAARCTTPHGRKRMARLSHILNQNGLQATSGFEMWFDIGSQHLWCWGQNTSPYAQGCDLS